MNDDSVFTWLNRSGLGGLEYTYDPSTYTVAWSTPMTSNVVLSGEARFVPLSTRACLMLYRLVIDLPIVDELVAKLKGLGIAK